MDRTEDELILEDRFRRNEIQSYDEFESKLSRLYDEIIGDYGREEFIQVVLPIILDFYGTNYGAAGLEALSLLEDASYKLPSEIGEYFQIWAQQNKEQSIVKRRNPQLLIDISNIIGKLPPFSPQSIHCSESDLENVLDQLRSYQKPEGLEPIGKRPPKNEFYGSAEKAMSYKRRLAEHIELNTSIKLPVSSIISITFYESVANHFGL